MALSPTYPCNAIVVVDPFSTGAVYCHRLHQLAPSIKIYRVLSCVFPEQQLKFIPPGLVLNYADTIQYNNDIDDLIKQLNGVTINGVFAGSEPGVELTDLLSERLGVRTNGTKLSACRRDKYLMQDQLRKAGVRSIYQFRIEPETPFDEIVAFLHTLPSYDKDTNKFQAVCKPVRSCGTDNVTYIETIDELKQALKNILGNENLLGTVNGSAVLQEYLAGVEHVVDTVSLEGTHKTVAVWQYHKFPANGGKFVYSGMIMMQPDHDENSVYMRLVNYAHSALNGLGILNGPSHAEVMFKYKSGTTELEEPCLIEVGARLHGVKGSFVVAANACVGYNKIDVSTLVYRDPESFYKLPKCPMKLLKNVMQIFLISMVSGKIVAMPHMDSIRNRPSFAAMNMNFEVGMTIATTNNGWSSPGNVTLIHDDPKVIHEDYDFIVKLVMSPEFFIVAN